MKRRRPCPNIFSRSDSDSDTPPLNESRFRPRSTLRDGLAVPNTSDSVTPTTNQQPDTLDTFMNSLQSPSTLKRTPVNRHPPQSSFQNSSSSSDDEGPSLPSNSNDTATDERSTVHSEQLQQPSLSLPPVDYSSQPLLPVNRLKFSTSPSVESSTRFASEKSDVSRRISSLHATVRNGSGPILSSFQQASPPLAQSIIDLLNASFPSPSPIQSIAIPHVLSGRHIVAIAQTGSGKTLAYALPLLAHVAIQSGSSRSGNGPAGLVLVPTRDLAIQITSVLEEYGKPISVSTCCVVGGVPKYEQFKQIRDSGAAIIVCTPGRLIDMLRMRACRMKRCSFVVLDEADRMLDMGFGPQVHTVLSQIRPDAQRALFSATMPKFVERLISDVLDDPVHISFTGSTNEHTAMVSENVKDCFLHFEKDAIRKQWLFDHLSSFVSEGLLIIFCSTRGDSAALANEIRGTGMPTACIHGETEQADREDFLRMFRANELPILVTTDVAARGLDIENIENVVNYGCAKSWEWHVHRVGRCGRASRKGNAFTLMDSTSQMDLSFANEAFTIFRRERRSIPPAIAQLHELSRSLKPSKEGQRRSKFKRYKNQGG